jgi:hypothetical protein
VKQSDFDEISGVLRGLTIRVGDRTLGEGRSHRSPAFVGPEHPHALAESRASRPRRHANKIVESFAIQRSQDRRTSEDPFAGDHALSAV